VETEFAVESVRPRVADRADAAASLEYPRPVHFLLLAAVAGIQLAWLLALGILVYWLA
jgi:hypothetical protein